jgi:hypothetical protein
MAAMQTSIDLLVRQDDPRATRFVEGPVPDAAALDDGELLVHVEKFGFSANNVTYAVLGKSDIINYFDFFPTGEPGWGRVPVWGMAVVAASRHPDVARGERMYGYFPLARYARLRPARMTAGGFDVDRGNLPGVYNQYTFTRSDPFYLPAREDAMIVFRPLALTAILLDDFIADGNAYFGAAEVLIASASSKTSFALAAMLGRRQDGHAIVGLTSARNAEFTRGLGLYSRVVTYDQIATLPTDEGAIFVDVAGDAGVRHAVRSRLGGGLKATITVGLSHWDKTGGAAAAAATSGSEPTLFFFAPAWVEKRREDWGNAVVGQRIAAAWQELMGGVDRWVRVVRGDGKDAVASVYSRMVAGQCAPDEAHVLSL